MSDNGIITTVGKILKIRWATGERPLGGLSWMAIGTGDGWPDPENPPPESATQTALASEVARKQVDRYAYLERDDLNGTISFQGRKYKEVPGPTQIVAFYATFTESEAVGTAIMEEALFGGNVVTTATPYARIDQVVDPGVCFWVKNRGLFVKGSQDTFQVIAIMEEP